MSEKRFRRNQKKVVSDSRKEAEVQLEEQQQDWEEFEREMDELFGYDSDDLTTDGIGDDFDDGL